MNLHIAIVSDSSSWMRQYIVELAAYWNRQGHDAVIFDCPSYTSADVAFFLSYSRLLDSEKLSLARTNLVVHGSDLPEGRGWSPWSWQILEGRNRLALTLFEANLEVDSGPIYDQRWIELEGHELIDEWQARQARITLSMCIDFVDSYPDILTRSRAQIGTPSYYPKRRPEDSRLDPSRSLAEQFSLLRIVDNERYPTYFEHQGHRYKVTVEKWDSENREG